MKGNPFFFQERPGKNEKIFKMVKFRSMSEEKDNEGNYLPDEKRVTKYGEWLRASSLDELPELINIIKGDMAIVGPRPLLVQYLPLYNEEQKHRHDVRPGLTGLAQINGRFNILWKDKLSYDSKYAKNVTFIGDIKIIIKTFLLVFKKEDVENDIMGSWYPFLGNDVEDQQISILREKHKEIGSNYWNTELSDDNKYFDSEVKWFISGRAALNFIIKDILRKNSNVKSALLPSWCCKTMIKPFVSNNINVDFYSCIIKDGKLIKEINKKADIILNMNYFGFQNDVLNFDGIVINDITHSVFMGINDKCDYYFGSLRKWSGFKTGGFAYCNSKFIINEYNIVNEERTKLINEAMHKKFKYINGESLASDYKDIYKKAEEILDVSYEYCSSKDDIYEVSHFDIVKTKKVRQDNAKILLKYLKDLAVFKEVKENDCPLFVPIIVPNGKRDALQKYLSENKIYCPVHWPVSSLHKLNGEERYIYDNVISLVCDQRYTIEDMNKEANLVLSFINGVK